MSRSASTVVWSVVGVVVIAIAAFSAVFGPRLYREGKALVDPVVEIASTEKALQALDLELAFEPPADGLVPEERLVAFLEIRRQLLPRYQEWDDAVRKVDRQGGSWQGARDVLAITRDVIRHQIATLRAHRMPPAEFRALELAVYDDWHDRLDEDQLAVGGRRLQEATEEDLELVAELRTRHGSSPALAAIERHLTDRLDTLTGREPPEVDGTPEANARLFWQYREQIRELPLSRYELHSALRNPDWEGVSVELGSRNKVSIDGEGVEAEE